MEINFGWSPSRLPRAIGYGVLVAACALVAYVAWQDFVTRQQMALWDDDIVSLQRSALSASPKLSAEAEEKLKLEFKAAKRLIDRLDIPWDALFFSLEISGNERVALLSIDPDTERREVRLSGEAKDLQSMLDYVRALQLAPALRNVQLIGHQVNGQDAQRPVRFTIEAAWVPVPPPPKIEEPAMMGALT